MGAIARIQFDVPPDLLVERAEQAQTRLFEPWDLPGTPVAGVGRAAEGPIKPFINLLAWHRLRLIEVPEVFTEDWMRRQFHPLAPNNEGRLLHSLKFIGLVNASGHPEWDLWRLNRADPQDPTPLYQELIQRGYGDLEDLLRERPAWTTVRTWLRSRLNGSEQMLQRRFGFYLSLRLAWKTSARSYDGLLRAMSNVDAESLLPPTPAGGPKLILLKSIPTDMLMLKSSRAPTSNVRKVQMSLVFPPLEIVSGGRSGDQND